MKLVSFTLCTLSLFLIALSAWSVMQKQNFLNRSVPTNATFIGYIHFKTSDNEYTPKSKLSFTSKDGKSYTVSNLLSEEFETFTPGDTVPIFYDPKNPPTFILQNTAGLWMLVKKKIIVAGTLLITSLSLYQYSRKSKHVN